MDSPNPRLRNCLPCCIRLSLLKNGSQSVPALFEFAMTTYDTLVLRPIDRFGCRRNQAEPLWTVCSLPRLVSISWRICSRKVPSLRNVAALTAP
jgi:hypothetical protein